MDISSIKNYLLEYIDTMNTAVYFILFFKFYFVLFLINIMSNNIKHYTIVLVVIYLFTYTIFSFSAQCLMLLLTMITLCSKSVNKTILFIVITIF